MTIPPHKSKPQRVRKWKRDKENRDCPKYDNCLTDAALRNLGWVPCEDCSENPNLVVQKQEVNQQHSRIQPFLLYPPRSAPKLPVGAECAPLKTIPSHRPEPSLPKHKLPPKAKPIPKPPPKTLFRDLLLRGMYPKGGRIKKAIQLMNQGRGNLEICRMSSTSKSPVAKLRRVLETQNGKPFLCPCGKPATHPGWCQVRIQRRVWLASWKRKK